MRIEPSTSDIRMEYSVNTKTTFDQYLKMFIWLNGYPGKGSYRINYVDYTKSGVDIIQFEFEEDAIMFKLSNSWIV